MRLSLWHLLLFALLVAPMQGCPVKGSNSNPDPDGDGLSNSAEAALGTSPIDPDTDGDGYRDGEDPEPLVPTPPGVPGNLWAEDLTTGVRVSWTRPAGRVDEYRICSAAFIFNPFNTCVTLPWWTNSFEDTSLSVGQGRAYWVRAINAFQGAHLESPAHDSSFDDPYNERLPVWGARIASGVPPSPRFTAIGGDGQLQVDWQPSSDPGVTDYRIALYTSGAVPGFAPFVAPDIELFVPAGGSTQQVVNGLPNGTDYFVRVHAVTAGGENVASATHQVVVRVALSGAGPPPPPDNLAASQASGYHFDLAWDPGLSNQVEDFDRYRVLRRDTPGGTPVVVAEPFATELRVPVRPGQEAWFSVVTLDEEKLESAELGPASALAPSFSLADRTLVVWNTNAGDGNGDGVNDSLEVALHYQARRGIPGTHLLGVAATPNRRYGQGDWSLFESEIIAPIRTAIQSLGTEQVYYVALVYGVPLYADTQQPFGQTSLDTWVEIALDAPVSIPANAFGSTGSTDFELESRHLLSHLDLPPTVNEIDAEFPEETMLFDHTVKRMLPGSVEADMFLTSRVDGFDALRAKEMVEAALYAEAYLSPAPGHYHGDAYLDRGDIPLGVSLGTAGPMGDFNSDGDPDEAGFWDNGDSDDLDETAIRAAYPGGGFLGFRDSDLDWSFMRLFFEDRGWSTYTEVTASEIGAQASAWADASVEASTPAAAGTPSLVQWALSSYNNTSYADFWTWAVGSVAHDRGSFTFFHPKDPTGTLPDWTSDTSESARSLPSFGCNALYRGAAAYVGGASECGDCIKADVLFGLLLEGHPFADAAARAQFSGGFSHAFGDPLYRPFAPGKVAAIDDVPPPVPDLRLTEGGTASREIAIHWSIEPPPGAPDLVIASLEYGTTPSLGTTVFAADAAYGVHHLGGVFELENLLFNSNYYYRVTVVDPAGNVTASAVENVGVPNLSNPIGNGGFEIDADQDGVPDGWTASGSPSYHSVEFLPNGGFEIDDDSNGVPDGWLAGGVYSDDGSESAVGLAAYRTNGSDVRFPAASIPLSGTGQEFELTGQVRRATPGSAELRVGIEWKAPAALSSPFFYRTERRLGIDSIGISYPPQIGTSWQPFRVRGRVPNGVEGIESVVLGFAADGPSETGSENWFDDVHLSIRNPDAWGGYASVGVVDESDVVSQGFSGASNHRYEIRARVRRETAGGTGNPRIRANFSHYSAGPLGSQTIEISNVGAEDWTEVVVTTERAPIPTSDVDLELLGAAGSAERFWFDQVSVRDVGF